MFFKSTISATCTAQHSINYMDIVFGKTYYEWATLIAHRISELNNDKKRKLKFGSYNLDKFVLQVYNTIQYLLSLSTIEINPISAALYAKMAWETNYVYWRDVKPYLTKMGYLSPKHDIYSIKREARLESMHTNKYDLIPIKIILENLGPLDGYGILDTIKNDYNVLEEIY